MSGQDGLVRDGGSFGRFPDQFYTLSFGFSIRCIGGEPLRLPTVNATRR